MDDVKPQSELMVPKPPNVPQETNEEVVGEILGVDDVTSRLIEPDSASEGNSDYYEDDEDFGPHYMTLCEAAQIVRLEILYEDDQSDNEGAENEADPDQIGADKTENATKQEEFAWTDDFSTFTSKKELYERSPGPTAYSQDPAELFTFIWDEAIITSIVEETNMYAWQIIDTYAEIGKIPKYLDSWEDTTVSEMYRFFTILCLMGVAYRPDMKRYWCTKGFGMPYIQTIMSQDRFNQLLKCLHFTDNYILSPSLKGNARKVAKFEPILQHCNEKFSSLYVPRQALKLEESLLLWDGQIKDDPDICIKCLELREAKTGYLLKYLFQPYESTNEPRGFGDETANVLKLMEDYLDVGHMLLVDNWYDQLSLSRYLKTRSTDVVGQIKKYRSKLPPDVKNASKRRLRDTPGNCIHKHCGDISLTTWNYSSVVTSITSTYHGNEFHDGRPAAFHTYLKYTADTGTQDQILSTYLFAKKRSQKWYFRALRSLIYTSVLNGYIIYSHNPITKHYLPQTDYFLKVCKGLLLRYPRPKIPPLVPESVWFDPKHHMPRLPDEDSIERRCAQCFIMQPNTELLYMCNRCKVFLCVDNCWRNYHSVDNVVAQRRMVCP